MGRVAPDLSPTVYDPETDPRVRLRAAAVVGDGLLRVTWSDDVTRDVDFSFLRDGKGLRHLTLVPEVFRDFEIEDGGHGIRWIHGFDQCADALRILADKQHHGIA